MLLLDALLFRAAGLDRIGDGSGFGSVKFAGELTNLGGGGLPFLLRLTACEDAERHQQQKA